MGTAVTSPLGCSCELWLGRLAATCSMNLIVRTIRPTGYTHTYIVSPRTRTLQSLVSATKTARRLRETSIETTRRAVLFLNLSTHQLKDDCLRV